MLSLPFLGQAGPISDPRAAAVSSSSSITWKGVRNAHASLMAQLVKNPPTMRETWVQSLGWEEPLEKGEANHSSILAWRIPWAV